jgi:DNA-directed RNA polymerase subunit RPC12/RpoP
MKTINEDFTCIECWKEIKKAEKTCRNHCPFCFTSLHVDWDIPGDRSTECHWKMYPTAYEMKNWDYRILFTCTKCWKNHWNKRATDDEIINLPSLIEKYREKFN